MSIASIIAASTSNYRKREPFSDMPPSFYKNMDIQYGFACYKCEKEIDGESTGNNRLCEQCKIIYPNFVLSDTKIKNKRIKTIDWFKKAFK